MRGPLNGSFNDSTYMIRTSDHSGIAIGEQVHLILPYSVILLLAVVGNGLVIVTLAVNRRMRTVTNVFLLNLAVSDLLLGVFCMPFTLAGVLLREFIFGEAMCRLIPYLQAVSVSVSSWTLVAMSIERYYAICHPLKSREWQTLSHAYRMIGGVWAGSLICMLPIAVLSELQPIRDAEKYKCRESWPSELYEQVFNIFLDVILLVVPLLIMTVTYSLITFTLWKAIRPPTHFDGNDQTVDSADDPKPSPPSERTASYAALTTVMKVNSKSSSVTSCTSFPVTTTTTKAISKETELGSHTIRSSNWDRSLSQKRRVIKMLFVVVMEFFICWTPLYVINTITLFDPMTVYLGLGYYGISFFQLLAYTSSCSNPITYCFMNSKFRQSFVGLFRCSVGRWRSREAGDVRHPSRTTLTSTTVRERDGKTKCSINRDM